MFGCAGCTNEAADPGGPPLFFSSAASLPAVNPDALFVALASSRHFPRPIFLNNHVFPRHDNDENASLFMPVSSRLLGCGGNTSVVRPGEQA
jgi:hypothetical protein